MEMITPEEIADEVLQCLQGGNSGHDIVSALDSSVLGPSFRGGYMRERALESLRYVITSYSIHYTKLYDDRYPLFSVYGHFRLPVDF